MGRIEENWIENGIYSELIFPFFNVGRRMVSLFMLERDFFRVL